MKSLCAPVLTIKRGEEDADCPVLLASNGCMIDSYKKDHNGLLVSQHQTCVFEERKCNIYGLTYLDKQDVLFAYGEKLVAVIHQFSSTPQKQVFTFKDWIQALRVFNKQEEPRHSVEIVTLSINNAVQLLRLDVSAGSSNLAIEEVTTVKSSYRVSITHSVLDGDSWNSLRTVAGTVMGDIIISYPSKSSSPFHVLRHHMGMIFGLLIKCNFLFSVSDDRSLHMWSLDDARHLDECYGHSTRPFSICDGPQNVVFTGSQDGCICMWLYGESFVSLLKLIHTGCGVIRSFLFVSQELFFGTDYGFFGSVTFPENIENMQTVNLIYPNLTVQSFVAVSQQCYYILDLQGTLYEANAVSLSKIMQCSSARSNSLKLSPCRKYVAFSEDKKMHVLLLHLSEDMSEWINHTLQIDVREIFSCVTIHAGDLFLGTNKGSIVVAHDLKMKQIIKRAHGKNGVTDVKFYRNKLLSIGRDGKLCIWKRDYENPLQLLSWSKPSTAIEMEWPCRFLEATNQLYVAGFRGGNFILVNYESGHCVCDVWCGGRRRSWCLSVLEENGNYKGSKSLCFEFVIKKRISRITLYMSDLRVIKPNLHLSNITSIAVTKIDQKDFYVTGGIDAMLVLSRFTNSGNDYDKLSGSVEVVQRLQAHSSSVYCISAMSPYLISVGGKSEIFIWRLEAGNLQQLFNTRMKGDCRLLSVQFVSVSPYIRFVVSCSDGRLMIYELSKVLDSKKQTVLFESFGGDGIMVKVSCASLNEIALCGAVSSTGMLHIWSLSELVDVKDHRRIEVEKCGLSALSMYSEDDLRLHRTAQSFLVFSIALDCRLAVFLYSPGFKMVSYYQFVGIEPLHQ
uniref:tRNA (34-2'-O)-methyltransferase regulator WDR6 n=1 Tax=Brugia malayi TaxID=6279 RepID=A0A1I9GF04_BRUMA|nr:Bm6789, isoform g [Brugia malayi]